MRQIGEFIKTVILILGIFLDLKNSVIADNVPFDPLNFNITYDPEPLSQYNPKVNPQHQSGNNFNTKTTIQKTTTESWTNLPFDDQFKYLSRNYRTFKPNVESDPVKLVIYEYRKNVKTILGMSSVIIPKHINTKKPMLYLQEHKTYMRRHLDPLPGDDMGHLVAVEFSGRPIWYNIVPQNRLMYRKESEWYRAESKIKLELFLGHTVEWKVIPRYGTRHRPARFDYKIKVLRPDDGIVLEEVEGFQINGDPDVRHVYPSGDFRL